MVQTSNPLFKIYISELKKHKKHLVTRKRPKLLSFLKLMCDCLIIDHELQGLIYEKEKITIH